MLILDSNTISYYMRGDPLVVQHMQALQPNELSIPAVVEYELRYGLERLSPAAALPRLEALAQLLGAMQSLPFDGEFAKRGARQRALLEAAGTPIGPHDLLIAATALRHQAPLVTRNVREFGRVPGLQCINWHDQAP